MVNGLFLIPNDKDGKSELTGEGGPGTNAAFTCTEIEVYKIKKI